MTATEQERLLMSPAEAAQMLGIGRTKLYELIATGQLRPVHIGRCCRLPNDELQSFVGRLRHQEAVESRRRVRERPAELALSSLPDRGDEGDRL